MDSWVTFGMLFISKIFSCSYILVYINSLLQIYIKYVEKLFTNLKKLVGTLYSSLSTYSLHSFAQNLWAFHLIHSSRQWLTKYPKIWPYSPPLTPFSGFTHYLHPFHSAPAPLALSLEQIRQCYYIKFFILAVPMPRMPSVVSNSNKPQGSLGPEQLQIHRPENFLKRTPDYPTVVWL